MTQLVRGSIAHTDTIRSGTSRRTASRVAQSTARSDGSDPSVPTTMGLMAMTASSHPGFQPSRGRMSR